MTSRPRAARRGRPSAPRVGLFGLLGSGNIGNDGSLEALLGYLRAEHPEAVLDTMCPGPRRVQAQFGVDGMLLQWYTRYANETSGATAVVLKVAGKGIDVFRTAAWVRRHDVVMVPGAGILETTLPLRPWGVPYALFMLCGFGKLFGKKVALVSVGANVIKQPATRWLFISAARLACYRSFRDEQSREAVRRQGLDSSRDSVYPDLVFALPTPPREPSAAPTVGLGVMAYHGGNDDRQRADQIRAAYVAAMQGFTRWLVDNGRRVRLFTGDDLDEAVVQEILADLRTQRPGLEPGWVIAEPTKTLGDLMRQMASVDTIVATRYHNVLCALKVGQPTLSVGYAAKNDALMADMGLGEFCQSARAIDLDLLIKQFTELENRSAELRQGLAKRNAAKAEGIKQLFAELSSVLFAER